MIARTTGFDPAKGDVLGKFILYFVCAGQQSAERLGYSPLPTNLVEASFDAVRQIPGTPTPPPLSKCANPYVQGTFNKTGDTGTQATGPIDDTTGDTTGGGKDTTTDVPIGPTGSTVSAAADPIVYAAAATQIAAGAQGAIGAPVGAQCRPDPAVGVRSALLPVE